jgi:hypothetical protein
MDRGSAEDPCRRGTCQGISGDLTSKRDTLTAPHKWFKTEDVLGNDYKRLVFETGSIFPPVISPQ